MIVEFSSKETRDTVRNGFRKRTAEGKWESAVTGIEVWQVDPLFVQHRNRPLFATRKLIAAQKGVPVSSVVVDKTARKLMIDGNLVAVQNLQSWQVKVLTE